MRSFSKKLAFVLAAAMVVTAFAPAAKAEAAKEMAINKQGKILYVTDGKGINDAAQVGGGKGNVSSYDFAVSNKPADWKTAYTFAWSSSDEDVITVKNGGLTTAVGAGKADVVCVVTEKATGKATTLKNTVTVKANAAEVVITNADDYANTAVEVGDVVDLNRAMYDANGTKAPKRGVVVTDYTRWMVEPSTGVKVDSTKGTFEFTEEAVAGEYKLWAETYQSKKYQAATAKSDVVKVELVKDMTFDVAQDSTTQFTLKFNNPVKALTRDDVAVSRMLGNYPYTQQVKSVVLAKDGLTATVTIFGEFKDQTNYTIKVTGFEDYTLTASVGKPVDLVIVAKDKNPSFIVTTNEAVELVCKFYDAAGVDVTSTVTENVSLRLEKPATAGEYFLASKKLTIKKNTASAVVIADYPGWFENGKRVGSFSRSQEFFAEDATPILPVAVSDYTVSKFEWGAPKNMQVKDTDKTLRVKLQQSNNDKGWVEYTNGAKYEAYGKNSKITFTAINPDICVINTAGQLTAFKTGTASFYVNLVTDAGLKTEETTPFAVIDVRVDENSYLDYIDVDNAAITVGTTAPYNEGKIKISGYDQYKQGYTVLPGSIKKIECLSDGFGSKEAIAAALTTEQGWFKDWETNSWNAKAIIVKANTTKLLAAMDKDALPAEDGGAATLYFKATYNNGWRGDETVEFSVTIQNPSKDQNYVQIMTSDATKDALRKNEDNQRDVKNISFEIFWMNNGVKVDEVDFSAYDAKTATEGSYQYKIFKDGQELDGKFVSKSGNKVTIKTSDVAALTGRVTNVVSGDAVTYNGVGAGVYTLALYKCYVEGEDLVQEFGSDIVVTLGDAGKYFIAGDQKANFVENITDTDGGKYSKTDAEKILKCFNINDRDNKSIFDDKGNVKKDLKFSDYYVDYTAAANSSYVYVKEITFYEKVNSDYVAYTVAIDKALEWRTTAK